MARDYDPYKLSSPRIFLFRMLIFLIIAGFVPLVLYRKLIDFFDANALLNGLIVAVLLVGVVLAFRSVWILVP